MKTFDTSRLFDEFKKCYNISMFKKYIMALSGVSLPRMKKVTQSNMEFNNLRVNEIIDIQRAINDISNNVRLNGKMIEWKPLKTHVDLETSQIYYDLLACLEDKDAKRIITALCDVSSYRLNNAIRSENDFNELKLNEVIKIGKVIDNVHNNVYEF